jgi:hypothetical protein
MYNLRECSIMTEDMVLALFMHMVRFCIEGFGRRG